MGRMTTYKTLEALGVLLSETDRRRFRRETGTDEKRLDPQPVVTEEEFMRSGQ